MLKNISYSTCFGVFSTVIASACVESWFRAVRTIFSECHRVRSDAILAQAPGGAPPAGFVRPMSRQQITERELSLPSTPDWHHPKRTIRFDESLEPEWYRSASVVDCEIEEPPRHKTLRPTHSPAVRPANHAADALSAELATTDGFFPSLVFHQVRPRTRAAANAAKRGGSSNDPKHGAVSVAGTNNQAVSQDQVPSSVETLFTELAARCLGNLAAKERPR